jgi:DNA-binding response OmpR family regulator
MTPERWANVGELFARARGLSNEERRAALAELCGEDADLLREVEELLASHDAAESFLARPVFAVSALAPSPEPRVEQPDAGGGVLVVDDTPENVTLLAQLLRGAGHRVRVASSGTAALRQAHKLVPELVLLDVRMPDLDGYEVCRRLKADPATSDVPVLFLSALDGETDKTQGFEVGGVDYVVKPFFEREVLARVDTHLQLHRLRQSLARQNDELKDKVAELEASRLETALVFSSLSETLPGTVLDRKYRLEAKVGAGGFGAVFRATHLGLGRAVAVKVFSPAAANASPVGLERFRLEAASTCRVDHPNAVAVFDAGVSDTGIAYIVEELLDGSTLADALRSEGRLTFRRCAEILAPVCAVLAEASAQGMVHRDVKPENVFLHRTKGTEVVKVLDFGIAKLIGGDRATAPEPSRGGGIVGSPSYMAPERFAGGRVDPSADVYSVGVMLFQMLSGELPFATDNRSEFVLGLLHSLAPVPSLSRFDPSIPTDVARLLDSTMSKDPAARPSASELADAFESVLAPGEE